MNYAIPEHLHDFELREWLKNKISELDETKRTIRDQIRQFSNERASRKTREDFAWLRKAKAKISFLIAQREELRGVLGDVNVRLKEAKRKLNSNKRPNIKLAQAFMMVAQEKLNEDLYSSLESEALLLIDLEN
ncbi:MAG: hypothetical protein MI864_26045 [Pseudomonadales bacterium]|uniref:Uncharacterized protein n=1 Tax=Oleiphilus messinensis TaxID=141451 RepID=A0A1Y0I4H8_9GAMM|nr:hypothetical protein [Oleiphilus messinensis]ARU54686.1 hypothetical protein OLMES_0583 [Oleiphilus messinensis]MCG8613989.1 hypothetical protein [Pseudomonadales bacterium]